jgi:hypothetical protein
VLDFQFALGGIAWEYFFKSDRRRLNSLNSIFAFGEKYFSRLAIVEKCASSENKNMDMRKKQFQIKMLSPAKYIISPN